MPTIGYLQARAYTSNAQIPLRDVAVVVTAPDQTAIAMRVTDRSGLIAPIEIPVPNLSESQEPGAKQKPYAVVNLTAYRDGYGPFESKNIQIFADTLTFQDLKMIPLSQLPLGETDSAYVVTPPQNL
ncbi:MAG: hypothetical protein SO355_02200 [Candidatus Faecousia sp.]|nr:hypothetical protein [Bacillota bacterium]MDY4754144.1 hypothetical protein [Candidatus Faecousia sp.]MDY6161376.1 hypothetical protein [Candidatus Faecousia sp.]